VALQQLTQRPVAEAAEAALNAGIVVFQEADLSVAAVVALEFWVRVLAAVPVVAQGLIAQAEAALAVIQVLLAKAVLVVAVALEEVTAEVEARLVFIMRRVALAQLALYA